MDATKKSCRLNLDTIYSKIISCYLIKPKHIYSLHSYICMETKKENVCGQPCEVYSRVVGYYRPVQNWNKGKTEEFKDRIVFKKNE